MEKQVIYRDRQELQAADLNNTQNWVDEASCHLVMDAITPERQYIGLTLGARSATEIEVAPGRLYDGPTGKVYVVDVAQVHSVFSLLPLQDRKWLAVSVFGKDEDTDIQPRDFLIDLQSREVEPDAVAMLRRRVATVHIAQGLESPTPERPEPPTGYTLLGHVLLSPSGVQEVELAISRRLPNLQRVDARLQAAEGWILAAEPRIAHLMSDMAGLGADMQTRATVRQAIELAIDLARVKERLEIPDDYRFYGADHYLTDDESDTTHPDWHARNHEGIRPPVIAQDTRSISLLNPLDPDVRMSQGGLMLPAYDEVTRLRMESRAGELTLNAYQYQTTQMVQRTLSRERVRYGETITVSSSSLFWQIGRYDAAAKLFRADGETWEVESISPQPQSVITRMGEHTPRTDKITLRRMWTDSVTETYWDAVVVNHTIQGSLLAQTVLMAQTGWLTSVELFVTHADPAAGLTLSLVEAGDGQPDLSRAIASMTLAPGALNAGWCKLSFTDPVLVESGRRYALVLSTGGAHRVGFSNGSDYTQGVLMYRQDGQWLSAGSEDRDLMLRLNFARFSTPRAIAQMQPMQLAGGIADIDLLYDGVTPSGCRLVWEYQSGGVWRPVTPEEDPQFGGSAMLPLRAVFVGTTDLMPAVRLAGSQAIVDRVDTHFCHISTERTLTTPSIDIRVRLLLEHFDAAAHAVDCRLLANGAPITAASWVDEEVDARRRWREYRFVPGSAVSAYRIRVDGSGVTATAPWHIAERYDLAL